MNHSAIDTFYASEDITWSDPDNQRLLRERLSSDIFTPHEWQAQATANVLDCASSVDVIVNHNKVRCFREFPGISTGTLCKMPERTEYSGIGDGETHTA